MRATSKSPWKKKNRNSTLKYEAVGGSHFFGLVNYTISGASEKCFIHVYKTSAAGGRNLIATLDTPVFTDRQNTN